MKNTLYLHLLVFVFGFAGIIGKLSEIDSNWLALSRMAIASVTLWGYLILRKRKIELNKKLKLKLVFIGCLVALHWLTFFKSVDVSNVSIMLASFSTVALFTSVLEPLITRKKWVWSKIGVGVSVTIVLFYMLGANPQDYEGVMYGVISAFFAALFTILNAGISKDYPSDVLTVWQLSAGAFFLLLYNIICQNDFTVFLHINGLQWFYIFILGIVGTCCAFLALMHLIKKINPFTIALTGNMEPVYGIIMAVIIFPETEKMHLRFYFGTSLIVLLLILNGFLDRRSVKKSLQK